LPNQRVLIVDDEPYLVRSLSFVLKKEGFLIESASDGKEAIEKANSFHPRLIFLDLQLPKMDGFEVCRAIRANPDISDSYIILLTAKGQEDDRRRGMEAGANEYLTKPFSPKDLLEHLRELFGS
jgi:two-component system, OmpR family, alkaline phosphatase synthesis response regulator PhoP